MVSYWQLLMLIFKIPEFSSNFHTTKTGLTIPYNISPASDIIKMIYDYKKLDCEDTSNNNWWPIQKWRFFLNIL